MKTTFLLFAGLITSMVPLLCPPAMAGYVVNATASPGSVIPDNDLNGLASTITLDAPFNNITGVGLTLDISGGFNGDYYAYLQYDSSITVLLDRLDSSPDNPFGSPGSGLEVSFSDAAANISTAPATVGAPLTGTWAPQVGSLSTFNGMDPNGDWTLFIADESPGGVGTLENWSLNVTGSEVQAVALPEPGNFLGGLLLLPLVGVWLFRRYRAARS